MCNQSAPLIERTATDHGTWPIATREAMRGALPQYPNFGNFKSRNFVCGEQIRRRLSAVARKQISHSITVPAAFVGASATATSSSQALLISADARLAMQLILRDEGLYHGTVFDVSLPATNSAPLGHAQLWHEGHVLTLTQHHLIERTATGEVRAVHPMPAFAAWFEAPAIATAVDASTLLLAIKEQLAVTQLRLLRWPAPAQWLAPGFTLPRTAPPPGPDAQWPHAIMGLRGTAAGAVAHVVGAQRNYARYGTECSRLSNLALDTQSHVEATDLPAGVAQGAPWGWLHRGLTTSALELTCFDGQGQVTHATKWTSAAAKRLTYPSVSSVAAFAGITPDHVWLVSQQRCAADGSGVCTILTIPASA